MSLVRLLCPRSLRFVGLARAIPVALALFALVGTSGPLYPEVNADNSSSRPFAEIIRIVQFADYQPPNAFGWIANTRELYPYFHRERLRLGKDFEPELWKFLGHNFYRHYFACMMLSRSKDYPVENQNPELTLRILEKAIKIAHRHPVYEIRGFSVTLSVIGAVEYYKSGNKYKAFRHKSRAERMFATKSYSGFSPAMYPEDREIYEKKIADPGVR